MLEGGAPALSAKWNISYQVLISTGFISLDTISTEGQLQEQPAYHTQG